VKSVRKCFAHVILFQCPECGGPLASAYSSLKETMDTLDGGQFNAECCCGWIGNGLDFLAVNQSVQPWETLWRAISPDERQPSADHVSHTKDWLFRVAKEIASFAKAS
jgi:hypothetical protein